MSEGLVFNMVGGGGGGIKLTGITITTPPAKTTYTAGETFDPAGMVVQATYSNGATLQATGYTYSPSTPLTDGTTKVTIVYTEGGVTKTAEQAITVTAPVVIGALNDCTWEQIGEIASADQGENYWGIGDRKAVVLDGTVGILSLSSVTTYAFIIGFNHNASVEGTNRIHFQLAKTALSGGTDVCLCDSSYNSKVSTTGYFSMNSSRTNSGGWASSQMRTNICGTSLSSYSGTIIAVIPAALRAVLKSVTKYTDNTGGGSTAASAVTATTDYFFLLSEYEVFGSISYANRNESSKQAQYAYYSAGNSKIKHKHNSTSTAASWWLRSPAAYSSNYFVFVYTDGTVYYADAYLSSGFAPGFCV